MSEIRPFLSTLVSATPVRSFTSVLPVSVVPVGTSPWSPQPSTLVPVAAPQPQIDVAAIKADAIVEGRAEGMRQTEQLRATLQQMIDGLAAAHAEASAMRANLIADAAATVVDAWLGGTGSVDRFLPVVRAWQARGSVASTAHVHPSEADALRTAIGESTLSVVADAAMPAGSLQLRGPAHELTHRWESRLAELREAIVLAIEVKS